MRDNFIGHYRTWIGVSVDDAELEVQAEGDVYYDGDGGIEVQDFSWTLEGASIPEEPAGVLESLWGLEELFLEDAWNAAYLHGSIKVGQLYQLSRGDKSNGNYPRVVRVLGVCKVPGKFQWLVVARNETHGSMVRRLMRSGDSEEISLMCPSDFYLPLDPARYELKLCPCVKFSDDRCVECGQPSRKDEDFTYNQRPSDRIEGGTPAGRKE